MITRKEIEALGRYNTEVSRGILHTPEHAARMAELQRRFNLSNLPVFIANTKPRRRWRRLLIGRWLR